MISIMWYQPDEFIDLRASARVSCDAAIRKGMSSYIPRGYGYNDSKTQLLLDAWASCDDTRRGLERFINTDYAKQRSHIRRKTVRAVLYSQDRLREEGDADYARSATVMRNIAFAVSSRAQMLAIMLAKADAAAIRPCRVQLPEVPTILDTVPSRLRIPACEASRSTKGDKHFDHSVLGQPGLLLAQ